MSHLHSPVVRADCLVLKSVSTCVTEMGGATLQEEEESSGEKDGEA